VQPRLTTHFNCTFTAVASSSAIYHVESSWSVAMAVVMVIVAMAGLVVMYHQIVVVDGIAMVVAMVVGMVTVGGRR
jgi:hypothetical protein